MARELHIETGEGREKTLGKDHNRTLKRIERVHGILGTPGGPNAFEQRDTEEEVLDTTPEIDEIGRTPHRPTLSDGESRALKTTIG